MPPSSPRLRCRLPPSACGSQACEGPRLENLGPRESSSPAGHPPTLGSSTPPPGSRERTPRPNIQPVEDRPVPPGPNVRPCQQSPTLASPRCDGLVHPGDSGFRLQPEAEIPFFLLPEAGNASRGGSAFSSLFSVHMRTRTAHQAAGSQCACARAPVPLTAVLRAAASAEWPPFPRFRSGGQGGPGVGKAFPL